MIKKTKILILISVLCVGVALIFSFILLENKGILRIGINLENKCCEECLIFSSGTIDSQKCLDNPKISEKCREFFEKNPKKEEDCLTGKIVIPSATNTQYDELKAKYENKKWHGTIKGETTVPLVSDADCKFTYTARIDEMRINFNAPETGSYIMLGPGRRISIDGKAVLESSHGSCDDYVTGDCFDIKIEISSFPFKLDGTIDFSASTIILHPEDPEGEKSFNELYVYTRCCKFPPSDCPPSFVVPGGITLGGIFNPLVVFKFEGDKIILSSPSNFPSNLKISGELILF